MISFVHSSILAGLVLVSVPILIHLLSQLRHRRTEWAAMEFLLQSYRKNRTWITLSHLLLLLLRILIVAAVIVLVARPFFTGTAGFNGNEAIHHVVIIDDSYSMADQPVDQSAWNVAQIVMTRLLDHCAQQSSSQQISLVRSSSVLPDGQVQPDIVQENITHSTVDSMRRYVSSLEPSPIVRPMHAAIDKAIGLIGEGSAQRTNVYVISDFRSQDWTQDSQNTQSVRRLDPIVSHLQLVRCVTSEHPNLGVTELRPINPFWAVGVPFAIQAKVTNFSDQIVRNVRVSPLINGSAGAVQIIDEIPPRGMGTAIVPLLFSEQSVHNVSVEIAPDSNSFDNVRYAGFLVSSELNVLIIDGDPTGEAARFIATAIDPSDQVRTGYDAQLRTTRFIDSNPLHMFSVVFLVNPSELTPERVEKLEHFVRSGGGLAIFMGSRVNGPELTALMFKNSSGLMPVDILDPITLKNQFGVGLPRMVFDDHHLFEVFQGADNPLAQGVVVETLFAVAESWECPAHAEVVASLSNKMPLAVLSTFGKGKVFTFLTSADPSWNNWARGNPGFPVTMLELQKELGSIEFIEQTVGDPVQIEIGSEFVPEAKVRKLAAENDDNWASLPAETIDGRTVAKFLDARDPGVYVIEQKRLDQSKYTHVFSCNVNPGEGNHELIALDALQKQLEDTSCNIVTGAELEFSITQARGAELTGIIIALLVALMVGESWLGYRQGYHGR